MQPPKGKDHIEMRLTVEQLDLIALALRGYHREKTMVRGVITNTHKKACDARNEILAIYGNGGSKDIKGRIVVTARERLSVVEALCNRVEKGDPRAHGLLKQIALQKYSTDELVAELYRRGYSTGRLRKRCEINRLPRIIDVPALPAK